MTRTCRLAADVAWLLPLGSVKRNQLSVECRLRLALRSFPRRWTGCSPNYREAPSHRGFDGSSSTEDWEVLRLDQKLDAAGGAWGARDEAGAFESEHHLVHAGRRDLEVPLHVGFRRRSAEDTAIGVDEGQVLTLLVGELGSRGHAPNKLIHRLIRLGRAIREEARMNIRYHVELSEAERF